MPYVVGEFEKRLLALGVVVATRAGARWKCWQCEKGLLILTREVDGKGGMSAAQFVCDSCGDTVNIYPAKEGGVQPALKMEPGKFKMNTNGGMAGRWT